MASISCSIEGKRSNGAEAVVRGTVSVSCVFFSFFSISFGNFQLVPI